MRVGHVSLNRFLIASLAMLLAGLFAIPLAAQNKRLDIVVSRGSVQPRVDANDTEVLYMNGQPGLILHQGQPGGLLVPVERGISGQLELYLTVTDTVHWVQSNGQGGYVPYGQAILFEPLIVNPCVGAQTAPGCVLNEAGSPYYSCEGCGDPRLVVHSANAASIAEDFKSLQSSADTLQKSAASTAETARAALKSLGIEKTLSQEDKRQLTELLERILRDSRYAEADALRITGRTKVGIDVITHPSTSTQVLPSAQVFGGPEVDLLCANESSGKPVVSVGPWHGDLKRTDISWVNAKGLRDRWSVSAASVNSNPPDQSCANKKFVAADDYAGVCVAQKPPESMSFDVQVTNGDCAGQKPWHCTATPHGGRCALGTD